MQSLASEYIPEARGVLQNNSAAHHSKDFIERIKTMKPRQLLNMRSTAGRGGELHVPLDFVLDLGRLLKGQASKECLLR